MSQRPRRYRTERRACVDLSARVNPETGIIEDNAEYRAAVIENDPISHDRLPHPLDWTEQLMYCPKCFNCFTRATYDKLNARGPNFRCPLCNQPIGPMLAYGTPVITPKEVARQDDEINIYRRLMERAFRETYKRQKRSAQEDWWNRNLPEFQRNASRALQRGIEAMNEAYEAKNPGGSYFEVRNRRWERYENDLRVTRARRSTSAFDVSAMHRKRERVLEMKGIQGDEKVDVLKQMDECIDLLEARRQKDAAYLAECEEEMDNDILLEGRE